MRIRVVFRKNRPTRWILEHFDGSTWREDDTVYVLILDIFSKKTEKIYTNNILPSRE